MFTISLILATLYFAKGKGGWSPPIKSNPSTKLGMITSHYGNRSDGPHNGIDFNAPEGTPILAPANGIVESVWFDNYSGNAIRIDHKNTYKTGYGHLSKIIVTQGQKVSKGQIIGYSGNTGYSFGAHLHFTLAKDGELKDPYKEKIFKISSDGQYFV